MLHRTWPRKITSNRTWSRAIIQIANEHWSCMYVAHGDNWDLIGLGRAHKITPSDGLQKNYPDQCNRVPCMPVGQHRVKAGDTVKAGCVELSRFATPGLTRIVICAYAGLSLPHLQHHRNACRRPPL